MNNKIEALRARKADGGFTLVELLIVIVVLGILAGITVFGVANFRDTAETAACDASVKTVQIAQQAYLADTGNNATAGAVGATHILVTGGYISDPGTDLTVTIGAAPTYTVTCTNA